jgi:hypothetical protein
LPSFFTEYKNGIFFPERFGRLKVIIETAGLFFLVVCAFSISYYIWIYARASIRFISFGILSSGLTIAKMILSDSLSFKAFRGFFV